MIKICYFEFEELPAKNHWITFAQFGYNTKSVCIDFQSYRDVRDIRDQIPELGKEDAWQISFDQSTSNSGIFIKNYNNTRAYMVECRRAKGQSADEYIFEFEMLVHELCKGARFTHLLYERPIKTESYRSSEVLFQLEGMLRQLPRRYDEFTTARLDYIENASWRSVVVDTKTFSSYDRKGQTFMSIKKIYPWTNMYGLSIGSDYDVYEAMGVMFGWFINSFDELGRPYVRGDRFVGCIGGFLLTDTTSKEIAEALEANGIKALWFVENPRKSIYENIVSGLQKFQVNCVEISSISAMMALYVECNRRWDDPPSVVLVAVPANFTDRRLFDITGKEYHFVI